MSVAVFLIVTHYINIETNYSQTTTLSFIIKPYSTLVYFKINKSIYTKYSTSFNFSELFLLHSLYLCCVFYLKAIKKEVINWLVLLSEINNYYSSFAMVASPILKSLKMTCRWTAKDEKTLCRKVQLGYCRVAAKDSEEWKKKAKSLCGY